MQRRKFSREFKLEAVRLVTDRGVAVGAGGPAIWISMRMCYANGFGTGRAVIRSTPFPGHGQMKPEQQGDRSRLRKVVAKLKAERDILKKGRSLLREGSDMRFAFIARHRSIWPVAWLCSALDVSRSGFHAWLNRSPSTRSRL